jgi:X-X-X-Leu-X-X-Gly heptad repeat protein
MKIQSWLLLSLLAPFCTAVGAQDKGTAQPQAAAQATLAQKAEALTEEQIKQSRDVAALSRLAQLYNSQQDMQRFTWALARVSELMPNSGDLKLQLAMAYAKVDDKTHAYDTLMHMQIQGFGYDIANDHRFDPIHGTKVWDYIVANLQVNARQFGEGKVAFELPKGDYLFDALAWDAKRKQFLVGSARAGTIQLADGAGKLADFIVANADNGLWGVDALGVDGAHGKLYAASSAAPQFKGFDKDNAGKSGVFEFDLASGKLLHKYILPQSDGVHRLSSLAVGKDGGVYAADGTRREIYKLDGNALKLLISNPRLDAITALALSDDGKTLYIADLVMGIFGFDLTKSTAFELAYNPTKLVLGGINGLHWYDGNLVAIEGGMVPRRVMRLKLSADGLSIAGVMPLDVSQPAFDNLGQGTLADDSLYFVANRQNALYDKNGVLTDRAQLEPTRVFRSNLRFAWGQSGIGTDIAPVPLAKPGDVRKPLPQPQPQPQPTKPANDATKPASGDGKH